MGPPRKAYTLKLGDILVTNESCTNVESSSLRNIFMIYISYKITKIDTFGYHAYYLESKNHKIKSSIFCHNYYNVTNYLN